MSVSAASSSPKPAARAVPHVDATLVLSSPLDAGPGTRVGGTHSQHAHAHTHNCSRSACLAQAARSCTEVDEASACDVCRSSECLTCCLVFFVCFFFFLLPRIRSRVCCFAGDGTLPPSPRADATDVDAAAAAAPTLRVSFSARMSVVVVTARVRKSDKQKHTTRVR
jgi:hypothetical protein